MKKIFPVVLVASFLFTGCIENSEHLASKISKESNRHVSVSYKILQKSYSPSLPDTTLTPFEVWVVRDNSDTLRNGYVWVNNNYRPYNMIYDAGNYYLAIPPKKTTVFYPNYEGNLISELDWIDVFLNPEILTTQIDGSGTNSIISDTIYQGKKCDKIVMTRTGERQGKITITYMIEKENLFPLWAKKQTMNKDNVFFEELFFSDLEFDKVDLQKLKEMQKTVLKENPVQSEGTNSETSRLEKMLHIGDKAPLFAGNFYPGGEDFQLADYIGKNVIIVDFWYTHCPPCVRAMPALSELFTKYKDRGLKIYGLNSVDNQPHSLDNLDTFLGKRELSYDVILTEPAVDRMYKISGYPTMYIVDKEGNIALIEVGFDDEKFRLLTEKVEELTRTR